MSYYQSPIANSYDADYDDGMEIDKTSGLGQGDMVGHGILNLATFELLFQVHH